MTKVDTSQADHSTIQRDDSKADKPVFEVSHINTQHVNPSTYTDWSFRRSGNIETKPRGLFLQQMAFNYEYLTDEKIDLDDSMDNEQDYHFFPDVSSGDLGQKIKHRNRKTISANLKKINKVKQGEIDADADNFVDL